MKLKDRVRNDLAALIVQDGRTFADINRATGLGARSKSTLSRILYTDESNLTLEKLENIANALGKRVVVTFSDKENTQ